MRAVDVDDVSQFLNICSVRARDQTRRVVRKKLGQKPHAKKRPMPPLRNSQLEQERTEYRASIKEALEEDEDPLAAYDDFIKWTSRTFPEKDPGSGLIQLLEETTRKFKDDARYSGDLRYLKLWCSYAKMVEKPALVYAHLVKREIGCVYGMLWEEYALALEKEGRCASKPGLSWAGN